ncbi:hypothetical protein A0H76_1458 [Hepatospora eriocheir]|uniref:Ribosomal RNA-processing protein 42 n=1 Tax=Hepatospora eriocheir TaxID=1081669 RepID=A0A1X0QKT7_9MICR|nr:hypothetical protein A0H76_1458 [Hepatospora eriocheir]
MNQIKNDLNKEEKEFINKVIANSKRIDGRKFKEQREFTFNSINNNSYIYTLGNTAFEMKVDYKGKTSENNYIEPSDKLLSYIPDFLLKMEVLEKYLSEIKISVSIDIKIYRDDGNVYDGVFNCLSSIFSDIQIPCLNVLDNTTSSLYKDNMEMINRKFFNVKIDLGFSTTYAIFGTQGIIDPILAEENSCDVTLHIHVLNYNIKYYFKSDGKLSINDILELFKLN